MGCGVIIIVFFGLVLVTLNVEGDHLKRNIPGKAIEGVAVPGKPIGGKHMKHAAHGKRHGDMAMAMPAEGMPGQGMPVQGMSVPGKPIAGKPFEGKIKRNKILHKKH